MTAMCKHSCVTADFIHVSVLVCDEWCTFCVLVCDVWCTFCVTFSTHLCCITCDIWYNDLIEHYFSLCVSGGVVSNRYSLQSHVSSVDRSARIWLLYSNIKAVVNFIRHLGVDVFTASSRCSPHRPAYVHHHFPRAHRHISHPSLLVLFIVWPDFQLLSRSTFVCMYMPLIFLSVPPWKSIQCSFPIYLNGLRIRMSSCEICTFVYAHRFYDFHRFSYKFREWKLDALYIICVLVGWVVGSYSIVWAHRREIMTCSPNSFFEILQ